MSEETGRLNKLVEIGSNFIGFQDAEKTMDDEMFAAAVSVNQKIYGDSPHDSDWLTFAHGRATHLCIANSAARIDAVIGEDGYITCAFSFNDDRLRFFTIPAPHRYVIDTIFANPYSDYHDRAFCHSDFELQGQKKVIVNLNTVSGLGVPQCIVYELCPLVDLLHEKYLKHLKKNRIKSAPDFE